MIEKTHMGRMNDAVLCALFILAIVMPLAAGWLGLDSKRPLEERRKLAERPALAFSLKALDSFPAAFEAYHRDHFGLRNALIRCRDFVWYFGFNTSPIRNVILGTGDGWHYVGLPEARDYMGRVEPACDNWEETWRQLLDERRDWLAERGISFVFGVIPESYSVYPEYLPLSMRRNPAPSLRDRLQRYMGSLSSVNVVDFFTPIALAKMQGTECLYQKLDPHWQDNGAFLGYRAVMDKLKPTFSGFEPLSLDHFTLEEKIEPGGSLNRMMCLTHDLFERRVYLDPVDLPHKVQWVPTKQVPFRHNCIMQEPDAPAVKLLMFNDSYGEYLVKYFSLHFQKSVFFSIWHEGFKPEWLERFVDRYEPDVVFWFIGERGLSLIDPSTLLGIGQGASSLIFNGSFDQVGNGGIPERWNIVPEDMLGESKDKCDGERALELHSPKDKWGMAAQEVHVTPFDAGRTIVASARAKTDYPGNLFLALYYTVEGERETVKKEWPISKDWAEIEIELVLPANIDPGSARVALLVRPDENRKFLVDSLQVRFK